MLAFQFNDFALAFLSVLFEGVPFLLLGSIISGLVDVFVSSERITRMLPKSRTAAVLASGALGLLFPMCECGSVIIIRRFLKKGLPLPCAVAYMLGAPIVSPIVALSTAQAFPGNWLEMTALRLGMGYMIAVGVALLLDALPKMSVLSAAMTGATKPSNRRSGLTLTPSPSTEEVTSPGDDFAMLVKQSSGPKKLLLAAQSATADFLDVAFFFVIGVGITSVFNTHVNMNDLATFALSPERAIPAMMVLASLLALCSTTDAFVAASFTEFPMASKLAFMVFGPMFDLKLFWLYSLIFKKKVVVLLGLGLFIVVGFLCWHVSWLGAFGP